MAGACLGRSLSTCLRIVHLRCAPGVRVLQTTCPTLSDASGVLAGGGGQGSRRSRYVDISGTCARVHDCHALTHGVPCETAAETSLKGYGLMHRLGRSTVSTLAAR